MNALIFLVILLGIIVAALAVYIINCQRQLRNINSQLREKLLNNTLQPLSLELINRELNELASNINECFAKGEILRRDSFQNQQQLRELIANISHDLRTPLTAIKGYQQLIEKDGLTDEQMKKLGIAQKYADELTGLIDRLFEYTYLLSAQPEVLPQRLNLTNLVTQCLAEAAIIFEQRDLEITLDCEGPVFVLADKKMMIRVMQNLIRNCEAYAQGNIDVRIHSGEKVVLSISNPISDSQNIDQSRLFDRFYTSDSARQKSTGLGLSIVKLLIQLQGGSADAIVCDDIFELRIFLQASSGEVL